MTDNDIIKILECCSKSDCENCNREWSYAAQWDCMRHIERLSLELINRQKAEIERLTVNMNAFGLGMKREKERADNSKVEAVKEFEKRLKALKIKPEFSWDDFFVTEGQIDDVVKQMIDGEQEEKA